MSTALTVTTNADQLIAKLTADFKHLNEKEMRGVVAKGANVIRDQAIDNAKAVGLAQTGMVRGNDGRLRQRHGKIPGAIYAFVRPNKGSIVEAMVGIDNRGKRGPNQTYHAFFLEYGTKHMAPKPFFRRSLNEAKSEAEAAMQARFDEAVGRMG